MPKAFWPEKCLERQDPQHKRRLHRLIQMECLHLRMQLVVEVVVSLGLLDLGDQKTK
jgi:hypothetical protein